MSADLDVRRETAAPRLGDVLTAALEYAALGWPVLPLKSHAKTPLTEHGLKDASIDAEIIKRWWSTWPDANVGIRCGPDSFDVLDIDPGGDETLAALVEKHGPLPPTLGVKTGRGRQLLFLPCGFTNSAGKLGPGLDTRGSGGYVVACGSTHPNGSVYAWDRSCSSTIAAAPGWLVALLAAKPALPAGPVARRPATGLSRYAEAALDNAYDRISTAPEGQRNHTLNREAHGIGRLVESGGMDAGAAERVLLSAALACGLTDVEARRTIESGFGSGKANPKEIPDRTPGPRRVEDAPAEAPDIASDTVPEIPFVPDEAYADEVAEENTAEAPRPEASPIPGLLPVIDPLAFRRYLKTIAETTRPTGIPTLDAATGGGLAGGTVITLTGAAGSCKSAFALQLAMDRARRNGGHVWIYAPDQGGRQPLKRLASTFGDIVTDDAAFELYVAEVGNLLRVVDETESGVSLERFAAMLFTLKDVSSVMIDTPQTVASDEEDDERQQINATMDAAKRIADTLIVPVFVPSHANRAATAARNRADRNKELSAGLGSAALEHRTQVMLFMEKLPFEAGAPTRIRVVVTKSTERSGDTFGLVLDPSTWRLREEQADLVAIEEARDEAAEKRRDEKANVRRADIRKKIMAVVMAAADESIGVSLERLKATSGVTPRDLLPMLTVLREENLLDLQIHPPPQRKGGHPSHFYRLFQGASK